MFTGLVETLGVLAGRRTEGGAGRLRVDFALPDGPPAPGESVAVHGPCLTVVRSDGRGAEFDVSPQTLASTTLGRLAVGARVHVERALRADGRLGGHLVLGHVDGVGRVERTAPAGRGRELWLSLPAGAAPYAVDRGSVAVDGVSLTLAEAREGRARLVLVPQTLERTLLGSYEAGTEVNVEADILGKYVRAFLAGGGGGGLTESALRRAGF